MMRPDPATAGEHTLHPKILIAVSLSHVVGAVLLALWLALGANQTGEGKLAKFIARLPPILRAETQNTENAKQDGRTKPPPANGRVVGSALGAPTTQNALNPAQAQAKAQRPKTSRAVWRLQFWRAPKATIARKTAQPEKRPAKMAKKPSESQKNERQNAVFARNAAGAAAAPRA